MSSKILYPFTNGVIPDIYFLCAGSSEGKTLLTSFDGALLSAGIGNTNLIKMSSIVPPFAREVKQIPVPQGVFLPIAYASISSSETGETISAAVAVAIPEDRSLAGVIMEHSNHAPLKYVEDKVRAMAEESMAMRGIDHFSLKSKGIETVVRDYATAFAGVVLWYSSFMEDK